MSGGRIMGVGLHERWQDQRRLLNTRVGLYLHAPRHNQIS